MPFLLIECTRIYTHNVILVMISGNVLFRLVRNPTPAVARRAKAAAAPIAARGGDLSSISLSFLACIYIIKYICGFVCVYFFFAGAAAAAAANYM